MKNLFTTTDKAAMPITDDPKMTKQKLVKIKHHHAKPYRKRHYGSLILLVLASLLLLLLIWQFNNQIQTNTNRARQYFEELFSSNTIQKQTVKSTYGFTVAYNPSAYYASALDNASGNLYLGNELSVTRAYHLVRISSSWEASAAINGALTIEYQPNGNGTQTLAQIESGLVVNQNNKQSTLVKLNSVETKIDGVSFLKTQWRRDYKANAVPELASPLLTTYVGIVNSRPFTITLDQGTSTNTTRYDAIINDIKFSSGTVVMQQVIPVANNQLTATRSIFDSLMFANIALAESKQAPSTEYISSLYGPTVVRVYNLYCQDVYVQGKLFYKDACAAGVGSGFFISSNGYIATNGHVAGPTVKDLAVQKALVEYYYNGDNTYINLLSGIAKLTQADFAGVKTEQEDIAIIADRFYKIKDSVFTAQNGVSNLLVTLGETQPEVNEAWVLTQNRKEYPEQDAIKRAKLVAIDYRTIDGVNGWKASDVAIIKIDGNNYPVAKLGNISDVSQGAVFNILGFPNNASNNGLVASDKSRVTLTKGIVSAIKDADGSNNKLIETDTVIGHGNSGGPALSEQGSVVGIASYTLDGSGEGNGVFNYVRDIGDLKNLATTNNITLSSKSTTQDEWKKGVDAFYKAHYSKAIKSFERVKAAYPAHPMAITLIDTANVKIKAGEEVKEFPIVLVLSALLVVVLIGAGVVVIIIIRHRKKHELYKDHVNAGTMQPMMPGAPDQYVSQSVPVLPQTAVLPAVSAPPAATLHEHPFAPKSPRHRRVLRKTHAHPPETPQV